MSLLVEHQKSSIDLENERVRLLKFLSDQFSVNAKELYEQYLGSDYKAWYDLRKAELVRHTGSRQTTSNFDCETLYLIIRALRPEFVVETGVMFGASSSHILEALRVNGGGRLYSIDLPNNPELPTQDFLVQKNASHLWDLTIGDSRIELPALLGRLRGVDIFHHDSLHTPEHMSWEYRVALEHLRPGGAITSHDVISPLSRTNVFQEFSEQHNLEYGIFRNVGVALVRPGATHHKRDSGSQDE